jgi:hypothetical protein
MDESNLMVTVAGNLFELKQVVSLRISDIRLSDSFVEAYPGPKLGSGGTAMSVSVSSPASRRDGCAALMRRQLCWAAEEHRGAGA